ncbi:MAG: tetraacyldisaccharide 4'-kinase, partial [Muribaculaceae bacterium]|nr:tetraacyldisaccharide 4'-kinase [Muribaculaceae bacterium]
VSGIANPRPLIRHLKKFGPRVKVKVFPDHHYFNRRDIEIIKQRFEELDGENKIIVTTEKDSVRLAHNPYFPEELKKYIYYQPIVVKFDEHTPENFDYELKKMLEERRSI